MNALLKSSWRRERQTVSRAGRRLTCARAAAESGRTCSSAPAQQKSSFASFTQPITEDSPVGQQAASSSFKAPFNVRQPIIIQYQESTQLQSLLARIYIHTGWMAGLYERLGRRKMSSIHKLKPWTVRQQEVLCVNGWPDDSQVDLNSTRVPEFPVKPRKSALNKQLDVCWVLCWTNNGKLV